MRSFVISIVIFIIALFLSPFITAQAVDLPIDIDAIGQQNGYGNAVTANSSIDLFTDTAEEVSEYMREQFRQDRERQASSLFEITQTEQAVDAAQQTIQLVEKYLLFSQPGDYINAKIPSDSELIPLWLIIVVFGVCALGGFIIAQIMTKRKKENTDVH